MDWIKKIKHRWSRFWLRVSTVPFEDASLGEWENFVLTAPRWLVEETAQKWFDDFSLSSHWQDVYTLLRKRCQEFDRPYVNWDFRQAHQGKICYVSSGANGASILRAVRDANLTYPFYVIAQNGHFRGVAFSDNLVVLGVININSTVDDERKIQEQNMSSSLSDHDVQSLMAFWKSFSCMMQALGLEPLKGRYWYRANAGHMATVHIDAQTDAGADEAFVIGKLTSLTKIEII